jgi:hypothetical protein
MPVITATYSEILISIAMTPYPSSYLVTTTAQTVTSASVPAIESTTSARVSSSMEAPPNGTSTSATLSAPLTRRTSGASSLASCSGFAILLIPAFWLIG